MERRWRSRSPVVGCVVLLLLLGCWGPREAAAAVSAERAPPSPFGVPRAGGLPGRGCRHERGGHDGAVPPWPPFSEAFPAPRGSAEPSERAGPGSGVPVG